MDPHDPLAPPAMYGAYPRDPVEYRTEPAVPPAPRPAWAAWADKGELVKWAFYGALAAGVLILLCAFAFALMMTVMGFLGGPALGWPWFTEPDGDVEWSPLVPFLFALWGLLTGGAVLLGALRLKEEPHASALPGVVILVGGLLSFLVFGGFLVGGLLAIVAGVLAIAGARSVFSVRGPRFRRGDDRPPSLP